MLKTDHIVFPVWDAKASLAFYRDVMGFALVDTYSGADWGGYPWLMMFFAAADGREIVLVNCVAPGAHRPMALRATCAISHSRKFDPAAGKLAQEAHEGADRVLGRDARAAAFALFRRPQRHRSGSHRAAVAAGETDQPHGSFQSAALDRQSAMNDKNVPLSSSPAFRPAPSHAQARRDHQGPGQEPLHGFLSRRAQRALVRRSFSALRAAFVGVNAVFALAYLTDPDGIEHARRGNFWDAFVFSAQTIGSINYSVMVPKSTWVNTLVIVEAFVGHVVIALFTGMIFARFSRPFARIVFSRVAVIAPFDGVPTLMFRAANQRGNQILDASITRHARAPACRAAKGSRCAASRN